MFANLTSIQKIILLAFGYFALNALSQYSISGVADLDQSEQLIASQLASLGYGPQPPLYTWIVWSLFQLTGPSLLSLLILKAVLLTGILVALIKTGELLRFSQQQLWITALGLALIPQFIWESQRDLSHSVLSTFFAAWLLWQVLRTLQNPTSRNYFVIGIFAGLGILSKYNFAIFIIAILLTLPLDKSYRHLLFTPKLFLTILTGLAVTSPHTLWMLQNFELAASGTQKLQMAGSVWQGLGSTLVFFISFLTPLWLFALIMIPNPWKQVFNANKIDEIRFLFKLLLVILLLALAIVAATQSQNFKDRWFLPLAFFAPLLIAYFATPTERQWKWFCGIAVSLIILVAVLLPARSIIGQYTVLKYDRSVLPFAQHISNIKQSGITPDIIISDDNIIAGNFKNAFPEAQTFFKPISYNLQPKTDWTTLLLICEKPDCLVQISKTYSTQFTELTRQNLKLKRSIAYIDRAKKRPYNLYWTLIQRKQSAKK